MIGQPLGRAHQLNMPPMQGAHSGHQNNRSGAPQTGKRCAQGIEGLDQLHHNTPIAYGGIRTLL